MVVTIVEQAGKPRWPSPHGNMWETQRMCGHVHHTTKRVIYQLSCVASPEAVPAQHSGVQADDLGSLFVHCRSVEVVLLHNLCSGSSSRNEIDNSDGMTVRRRIEGVGC